jgi:hypothetical protein
LTVFGTALRVAQPCGGGPARSGMVGRAQEQVNASRRSKCDRRGKRRSHVIGDA